MAVITIKQGDGAKDIAERLENAGVIQSSRLFRVLVAFMDIEDELVAGDYEFDKGMTTLTVIGRIHEGITAPVVVTIPEGLRLEEIGAVLEGKGVVSASDFLAATKKPYESSVPCRSSRYCQPGGVSLPRYLRLLPHSDRRGRGSADAQSL